MLPRTKTHLASTEPPALREPEPRTRAERVVRAVLDATIEELGRVGFGAFSIEEVAKRAGVNKTTVYRRWPTKAALAQAAFERFGESITVPDTGSLEGDLRALLKSKLDLVKTPRGRALIRGLHGDVLDPELIAISKRLHAQEAELYRAIVERARARREIRKGVDHDLLMQVIEGAMSMRFLLERRMASESEMKRIVDLVLRGAHAPR